MKFSCIPFSQILGQEGAVRLLREAMAKEKMPHAYLFVGIPGVGKTTTALALCRSLNCDQPIKGEGCGHCRSCKELTGGNFPDLVVLEAEGQNIKIEQVRGLERAFSFKAVAAKYRVTVVRRAETMTEEAANAFLKLLEEPPLGNILVLTVTEPLDLLPTILSRCQRVSFRPIPQALIEAWLVQNKGTEAEKARLISRMAAGSLGRALEMEESDFLEKRQDLLFSMSRVIHLSPEAVVEWALDCSGREKKEKREAAVALMLEVWKMWYRDLILVKAACPEKGLVNIDFSRELKNASGDFTMDDLLESFFTLDQAKRDLLRFRNLDLLVENAVLKLKRLYGREREAREQRATRKPEQDRGRSTTQVRQSPEL
jgi:DNA polymerase-3 subunit delta'